LFSDLEVIWVAFWRLNRTRQIGFSGQGAISISEIITYQQNLLSYYDLEDFVDFIQVLDTEYLNYKPE
jgi:hypothetical protein